MLLKVTLSDDELAAVDERRGGLPRATWVRDLVRSAIEREPGVAEPLAAPPTALHSIPARTSPTMRRHHPRCDCPVCKAGAA